MARKEPENFYRRQQEEANRIAAKQHRALVDLVRLAKSSNEELRKMRRAFEAFTEAVNGIKLEPFQVDALTKAGYRPPVHDDEPGAASGYMTGLPSSKPSLAVVDEAEGVSESMRAVMNGEKTLREHAHTESRAHRLGYGDVIDSPDERTAPPLDRDAMFACPSDCALDHEHIAAHGSDPAFWHEPEEECADVSEARRTPRGYAAGGYTGVSAKPFTEPQLAGIVHPGELWGTSEHLQHMRDLGLIAEGVITHETDAQLDMDRSRGRE